MFTNKIQTNNGHNLYHDSFGSVAEFVDWLEVTPSHKYGKLYNPVTKRENGKFYGTNTWQDAQELLVKGYPEGLKKMLECKGGIDFTQPSKAKIERAVVGFAPHVPSAIIGLPKNMFRKSVTPQKIHTISLYYDVSICCGIKKEVLFRAGKNVMALVKYLEGKNIRVNLNVLGMGHADLSRGKKHISICTIKIKDAKQALNPLLISYPATHPSFWRRHIFRWMEVSPSCEQDVFASVHSWITKEFPHIYAYDMDRYLHQNGILKSNDYYLDCKKIANATSIDDILDMIKFKAA